MRVAMDTLLQLENLISSICGLGSLSEKIPLDDLIHFAAQPPAFTIMKCMAILPCLAPTVPWRTIIVYVSPRDLCGVKPRHWLLCFNAFTASVSGAFAR